MENIFRCKIPFLAIISAQIWAHTCTLMSCATTRSDQSIRNWMRENKNLHQIWMLMEHSSMKLFRECTKQPKSVKESWTAYIVSILLTCPLSIGNKTEVQHAIMTWKNFPHYCPSVWIIQLYSTSKKIWTWFVLCCLLLWLSTDWLTCTPQVCFNLIGV